MKDSLIVLMDRAHMKIFKMHKTHKGKKSIELLEEKENIEAMQRMGDKLSDQAGRFGEGNGENHNLKAEEDKRILKAAVNHINSFIKNNGSLEWFFASEKSIHNRVLEKLDKGVADLMAQSIPVNLMNEDKLCLIDRFDF